MLKNKVLEATRSVTVALRARREYPEDARSLLHLKFHADLIEKTDNFGDVTWLGHPIWQNVLDLWAFQEAISEIRPAVILETGSNRGGSALFFAHLFDLMGDGRVVSVDVEKLHDIEHPRVDYLIGSSIGEDVLDKMRAAAESAHGPVMVILDSDHAGGHVANELEAYASFVTPGSLMLCQDGIIDLMPKMEHGRPGPLAAVRAFLDKHPEFSVDKRYDRRFLISHHPGGWLRRAALEGLSQ